jgi:tRNA/rRNA methyltransferase
LSYHDFPGVDPLKIGKFVLPKDLFELPSIFHQKLLLAILQKMRLFNKRAFITIHRPIFPLPVLSRGGYNAARKMLKPDVWLEFQDRFTVVLVRPESMDNIGLAARAMKNTGFGHLRVVGRKKLEIVCPRTAVRAKEIVHRAAFYADLGSAIADLQVVFAATAKARKNYSSLPFDEAVANMLSLSPSVKIGLLFGNERTGLTSEELRFSNFRFAIPQASRQPSYNLAAAVLLTLFEIFRRGWEAFRESVAPAQELPLLRAEQEECLRLILAKLEARKFIHPTNKRHATEMIHDLFGRLNMTDSDRRLLLAILS